MRNITRLETQWSPQPVISRWIAQLTQGELTWPQLEGIRRQAELGLTETWGDLTRRMLKSDAHLFSVYWTYVAAIAGARREIVAPRVEPQFQKIADEQADCCARMLDSLPDVERSISELLDADFTGYAVSEIHWEDRGIMWPTALEWLHPDRIRFSQNFQPYLWDRGAAAMRARELAIDFSPLDAHGNPTAIADVMGGDLQGLGIALFENKYVVHTPRIIPDYPQGSGIFLTTMRTWFVRN